MVRDPVHFKDNKGYLFARVGLANVVHEEFINCLGTVRQNVLFGANTDHEQFIIYS
jgi:hypothetical protein